MEFLIHHGTPKRLGVCLNDYSDNARLLDEALETVHREACAWYVIYIESERQSLDPVSRERLKLVLDKAGEAGAQIVRFPSSDVVQGIITAAELHALTHIIVGRRRKSRFRSLLSPTLASQLLKYDVPFELQVVTLPDDAQSRSEKPSRTRWDAYLFSFLLIIGLTAIIDAIQESLPEYRFNASIYNVSMIYLLAIIFCALRYGILPATLAAITSFGLYNYFFIPPFYKFGLSHISDVLNFLLFLSASLISVTVADSYKRNMLRLRERESASTALHALTRDTYGSQNMQELLATLGGHLREILQHDILIFLDGKAQPIYPEAPSEKITKKISKAALDTYKTHLISREGSWQFYPIYTPRRNVGALGVLQTGPEASKQFIEALCYQSALVIERMHLMHESEDIKLQHQRESLRSALLSSVSHDLKTPLVSIIGSLSSIRHMDEALSSKERNELIVTAIEEAERLNQSITNILDMTRIEAGELKPNKQWMDVYSLFSDTVQRLSTRIGKHDVLIDVLEEAFAISVDPVLFPQVLQNLLENALKYSPEDQPVTLAASIDQRRATLRITDHGPGIPKEQRAKAFDKFTRIHQRDARIAGTGLGLAICKAIIGVHGETITLEDNPNGSGLSVVITLKAYQPVRKARA